MTQMRTGRSADNLTRMAALNMDVELLVQSTQHSALTVCRYSGKKEKFHGWLWKKSGRFSKWKNQHFVLDGVLLNYYDTFPADQFVAESSSMPLTNEVLLASKGSCSPVGVVRVAHVERSKKSRIAFKVYAVSGKVLDLRAKNEHACNLWIERLSEASLLAKRQECNSNSSTSTASSSLSMAYSDTEIDLLSSLVDKSGWVEVDDKKAMRRLYCVLQGTMFAIYESEEPWAVPLTRVYVTSVCEHSRSTRQIQISTSAGKNHNRELFLRTKTPDEMQLWLEALRNALK